MRRAAARRLPRAVAGACAATGFLLIAGTPWAIGRQHIAAQWQFVVVAALGVGLVFVAGLLYASTRRREGEWRVEEALARMLVAAAAVPPRPTASRNGWQGETEELPRLP